MKTEYKRLSRIISRGLLLAPMLCVWAFPLNAAQTYAMGGDQIYEQEIGGTPYRIHVFTNIGSAELDVRLGGEIDYLVVAGGGGGGGRAGGGGGAGGVIVREADIIAPDLYPVKVGDGGAAGTGHGQNGGDSSFFDSLALGGGGGGVQGALPNYRGNDGGSGGGRGAQSSTVEPRVGAGLQPLQPGKSAGYGNDGYETSSSIGSGGGGAGAPGGQTDSGRSGATGQEPTWFGGRGGSGVVVIRYLFEESDFYIHLPFYYADRDTASREFTNSNAVDVVEFPLPLDYDRYQITESGDMGAIDPNAWISTAIPYT
ncbi:MAG: glycine-rich domain-containing protein, partial [Kiritimatiellia bacterium]